MPAILSAHDLNLWYGAHQALHNISIDIPEKSITALIGPSGCGKSTFLKTLNRMNDLVAGVKITGEVTYDGEDIYDPSGGRERTPQEHRHGVPEAEPLPHEHLRQHRLRSPNPRHPQPKHKLDEIVEKSLRGAAIWDEVKDRLKKIALGLSGGQQQRLCIARALAVRAGGAADGRAHLARWTPFPPPRSKTLPCELQEAVHDRHRDPQHAAGRPYFGQHRVFPAGRAGGVRPDRADVLPCRRTSAPRITSPGGLDE